MSAFKTLIREEIKKVLAEGTTKKNKLFRNSLNENVDATRAAKAIEAELDQKGLKGVLGKGVSLKGNLEMAEALKKDVDFVIILEKMAVGILAYVFLKNTPDNQKVAKEIQQKHGGDLDKYENGKIIGVTAIEDKK